MSDKSREERQAISARENAHQEEVRGLHAQIADLRSSLYRCKRLEHTERLTTARAVLAAMYANPEVIKRQAISGDAFRDQMSRLAVLQADSLIEFFLSSRDGDA